jgi:hypothetical protein
MPARASGLPVSLRATTSSLGRAELPLPTSTWRGSPSFSPSVGIVRSVTAATTERVPGAPRVSALRPPTNTPTRLITSTTATPAATAMPALRITSACLRASSAARRRPASFFTWSSTRSSRSETLSSTSVTEPQCSQVYSFRPVRLSTLLPHSPHLSVWRSMVI